MITHRYFDALSTNMPHCWWP